MTVRIIFDNYASSGFVSGWGISYWVGEDMLFDTGENFAYLRKNAKIMGLDFARLSKIALSHEHWDHTGGLEGILKLNRQITVFVPAGFSEAFKEKTASLAKKLVLVNSFVEISESIFLSAPLGTNYKDLQLEESYLVINSKKGLVLLCGCSHPGIVNMVKQAKDYFRKDIYAVLGGFHLLNTEKRIIEVTAEELKKSGVKFAGPSHCSGQKARDIFRRIYADNFLEVEIGKIFPFD
ncbi:MAG: MBL fold metallo-hydrolase [Candidatus Omnitrophica bacterium]|nr:MBL fold metallo-hydrolase [Candidatus Omnitrophota bacterium]